MMLATSVEQDAFMVGYLFGKYGLVVLWWAASLPLIWVVKRAGKSAWWNTLLIVPIIGFVVLTWLLAFSRWHRETI